MTTESSDKKIDWRFIYFFLLGLILILSLLSLELTILKTLASAFALAFIFGVIIFAIKVYSLNLKDNTIVISLQLKIIL